MFTDARSHAGNLSEGVDEGWPGWGCCGYSEEVERSRGEIGGSACGMVHSCVIVAQVLLVYMLTCQKPCQKCDAI